RPPAGSPAGVDVSPRRPVAVAEPRSGPGPSVAPRPHDHGPGTAVHAHAHATREHRVAELAVLGVMVLWAFNFIVVKSAVIVLPPVGFTFLRFSLASTTLLILLRWREGSIGLPRRDLIAICLLGGLGFGIYQILWTTGLKEIAAGDSALIIASTPVLVAFL